MNDSLFFRLSLASVCMVFLTSRSAQGQLDPAAFCKQNPADQRCAAYIGATSGFQSNAGNLGGSGSRPALVPSESSRNIVFIHTGAGPTEPAQQIATILQNKGYVVRGFDRQVDLEGGPGVDYFNEQDRIGAVEVAQIVNGNLPPGLNRLGPRFQKVSNPSGFLGVWLYDKSVDIDPRNWMNAPPTAGWCVQQPQERNFLVRCYPTYEICKRGRGEASLSLKTPCTFISSLNESGWKPSPRGWMESWYQESPTKFGAPFPQLQSAAQ